MARSSTSTSTVLLVGGGILAAGAALLAAVNAATSPTVQATARTVARTARALEDTAVDTVKDWITTLFRKTAKHEGYYWSVNRNADGQGVSYGFLQWTQRSGNLGKVLAYMRAHDSAAFDAAVGGTANATALLAHTAARNMGPLLGAHLWNEPWLSRFYRLGGPVVRVSQLPPPATPMQAAMHAYAAGEDPHMPAAVRNAVAMDVATERGMTLCYNRTVHQGVSGSRGPVDRLLSLWAEDPATRPGNVNDRLAQYAWLCAAKFRRTTPPKGTVLPNGYVGYGESGALYWMPVTVEWSELRMGAYAVTRVSVGSVWHVYAGPKFDLYDIIVKRSSDILLDPTLRDAPVELGGIA